MNKEIKDLNIKAKRKLYYLQRTYGLIDIFTLKTEFKNEKEEREYLDNLKEFLFSSKFKYICGGRFMSYRKSDYGNVYYFPIKRSEWKEIKKLIKQRNKNCLKKIKIDKETIRFNYQLKMINKLSRRKTK